MPILVHPLASARFTFSSAFILMLSFKMVVTLDFTGKPVTMRP